MPFDSLIAGVEAKKVDAVISGMNYTEERAKQVTFTEAYYTLEDSFVVAEAFKGTLKTPEDCVNYKVGVQTGTTQDTWLTHLVQAGKLKETNLFRYDRADQAALDLKAGRIEVLMADLTPLPCLSSRWAASKWRLKLW